MSARSRVLACLSCSLVLIVCAPARNAFPQDNQQFHFTEKPGQYSVGINVIQQYDRSRVFQNVTDELGNNYVGERARPLQTIVWYPAEHRDATPMSVADYVNLLTEETSFGHPKITRKVKELRSAMQPVLATHLWATRDASPRSGRFPVVIYAPSLSGAAWENADLCEYLASHGYVVIASPDMGATTRNMTADLTGIEAQSRDISFLIGYANTLANADASAVAVVGYSWGGISNLFAAARDSRINALVALDGSMRYFPSFARDSGNVHPEQMGIPLLYFAQSSFPAEEYSKLLGMDLSGPSILNAWIHGDFMGVHMLHLAHGEFSSMSQRNENMWWDLVHAPATFQDNYDRREGAEGYGWIARYTRQFLDGYLKHDAAAMAFLRKSPAENGVPTNVMATNFRVAAGIPVSFDEYRREIGRKGFDQAAETYSAYQARRPDFKIEESKFGEWTDELAIDGHLPEAIALLKLAVKLYPASSGTLEHLADAYEQLGQRQMAVDLYRKSLEVSDHPRASVKRKLAELEGRSARMNE